MRFIIIILLGFLALYCASNRFKTVDSNWVYHIKNGDELVPFSPITADHSGIRGIFKISGSFDLYSENDIQVKIIPDDCLRRLIVNGKEIQKQGNENWCNYKKGFSRNVNQIFQPGHNTIEAEVENLGGPRNLLFKFDSLNSASSLINLFFIYSITVVWILLIEKWLVLPQFARILLRLFSLISLNYLFLTPPNVRQYDVFEGGGHADYIRYVAENFDLPEVGKGWEYHQPPLYYILSACIYKIFGFFSDKPQWEIFQGVNWIVFQLFIAIGLKVIFENLKTGSALTASLLFALWPLNQYHAARIGNDNLLYLFSIISILFLFRFYKNSQDKNLVYSCIFAGLAAFTKNTGLPILASIFTICLFSLVFKRFTGSKMFIQNLLPKSFNYKALVITISLSFLFVTLSLCPKIFSYFQGNNSSLLFPGVFANQSLSIPIEFSNFIPFYLNKGIFEPFITPWPKSEGRVNFWNYLFKTSMTSELVPDSKHLILVGEIYLYASYFLLLYFLIGLFISLKKRIPLFTISFLLMLFSFGSLTVAILAKNYASNQDFRYVYFLLVPISMLISYAIEQFPNKVVKIFSSLIALVAIISGNYLILRIAFS